MQCGVALLDAVGVTPEREAPGDGAQEGSVCDYRAGGDVEGEGEEGVYALVEFI